MNAVVKLNQNQNETSVKRKGPPRVDPMLRMTTRGVTLCEKHTDFAVELGGGNLSAGVRKALDMAMQAGSDAE